MLFKKIGVLLAVSAVLGTVSCSSSHRQVLYDPLNSEEHVICTRCASKQFEELESELKKFNASVNEALTYMQQLSGYYDDTYKAKHEPVHVSPKSGMELLYDNIYPEDGIEQ